MKEELPLGSWGDAGGLSTGSWGPTSVEGIAKLGMGEHQVEFGPATCSLGRPLL